MRKLKIPAMGRMKTPAARLAHDLGNSIGALRIRVDMLRSDPAVPWRDHLEAMYEILLEASTTARKLEAVIVTEEEAPIPRKRPAARLKARSR